MGRHHTRAISDGLRKGSQEAGKVMAKWRWQTVAATAAGAAATATSGATAAGVAAAATTALPIVAAGAALGGLGYLAYKWWKS